MTVATLALAVGMALSGAPPPPLDASLAVTRLGSTARCDPSGIARRVMALLGRDPFEAAGTAPLRLSVVTREARGAFEATIEVRLAGGGGRRTLRSARRCDALDESVALAVAVAIDPLFDARAEPAPVLRPPEAEVRASRGPAEPSPPSAPARVEAPQTTHWRPLIGARAMLGASPAVALGPELGALLAGGSWGVGGAVHFHTSTARLGGETVAAHLAGASLEGCWRAQVAVCLAVDGGVFAADGLSRSGSGGLRGHAAAWLGLGLPLPGAEVLVSLGTPLLRQTLTADTQRVWRSSSWLLAVSIRVGGVTE